MISAHLRNFLFDRQYFDHNRQAAVPSVGWAVKKTIELGLNRYRCNGHNNSVAGESEGVLTRLERARARQQLGQ